MLDGLEHSSYPQNPAFDLSNPSFAGLQVRIQKPLQAAVKIASAQPFRGSIGVLLVRSSPITREAVAPQGRIYLYHNRFARLHLPSVKRPEMRSICRANAEITQPRDSGMGGFGD